MSQQVSNAREFRSGFWVRVLICTLVGVVSAIACGWSYLTDHSVRFNSYRSGRGFYRLPPLPIMYDAKTGKELSVQDLSEDDYVERMYNEKVPPTETDEVWERAKRAVEAGLLIGASARFREYLSLTSQIAFDEVDFRQKRRNSAYDILDAMTALQQGSDAASVKQYVKARFAYDQGIGLDDESFLADTPDDKNLRDNWGYLQAANLYLKRRLDDSLAAFESLARKYPRSEKNESIKYMIGKLLLEKSYAFNHPGCGILGKDHYGEAIPPEKIEPSDKCRDENWHQAVKAFRSSLQRFPNGRYYYDSLGWLGYLYRRGSEREKALAIYYRMLGNLGNRNARLEAKRSLQLIGHEYDDDVMDRLERMISGDVNTAMAYAYHRIYNHATDLTYQRVHQWFDANQWQERQQEIERVSNINRAGKHELNRIVRFAGAMLKRYPKARVSGGFVLRIAEAELEMEKYEDALKHSRMALSLGVNGEMRAEALWIKGSAEHHNKAFRTARVTFNQLIAEFPHAKLTEGSRRLVALTAEDQGDLETALEQYLALGYDYDVAYFVDVLMPTDRLAEFVRNRRNLKQLDVLLYALGIRYMRDKRWADARTTLRQLRTKNVDDAYLYDESGKAKQFAKEPDWGSDETQWIKSSWVMTDLKTIDVLEHFEQAIAAAKDDEAMAEAMYQLASYQFEADSLLFYNPAAWRGNRVQLLTQLNVGENIRLPNEAQIIFEHSLSHETLARAIPIYQEIVERFPNSKAAKDAVFTAVVAHERLSDLNYYWRYIYERGLFAGTRLFTNGDVRRLYPRFRWPRSRLGWEPSTRTVNDGPAYPPPPKPAPKLTLEQRIMRKTGRMIDAVLNRISSFFHENLNFILLGLGLYAIWRQRYRQ